LSGAIATRQGRSGIASWNALLQRYLGRARSEIGDAAADAAVEKGRTRVFEQAIAVALGAEGS
jgi:hypothetical protein